MLSEIIAFEIAFFDSIPSSLLQQDLAPVSAGEEDCQRLLLLPCRYDWMVRRQPDFGNLWMILTTAHEASIKAKSSGELLT